VANILHDDPLPWNPTNIRMYFIFLENRFIGLHFAADNIQVYIRWNFYGGRRNFCLFRQWDLSAVQGHPRSVILVTIKSLLVHNSNLGPILHRFGDLTAFMYSWPHPYSTLILGVFPLLQIAHVGRQRAHRP